MSATRNVLFFAFILLDLDVITSYELCECGTTWDCSYLKKTVIVESELCNEATNWKLQGNKLRRLPLTYTYRNYEHLDVSDNELGLGVMDGNSNPFSSVNSLDISKNFISDLSSLSAKYECRLSHLIASNNLISELTDIRKCVTLKTIVLENNEITFLPNGAFNVTNWRNTLDSINIAGNPIISISPTAFSGLNALKHLNISNTEISVLPSNVFENLRTLETLFLNNNLLSELKENVFRGRALLKILLLNGNKLTKLPTNLFQGLVRLQYINLEKNNLLSIPEEIFDDQEYLESLNLDNNLLAELPSRIFARVHSLKELSVRNNKLKAIPSFCGLPLRSVLFNKNMISALEENAVRSLLRIGFEFGDLRENPVKIESTDWIKERSDMKMSWSIQNVCGRVLFANVRGGTIEFCIS